MDKKSAETSLAVAGRSELSVHSHLAERALLLLDQKPSTYRIGQTGDYRDLQTAMRRVSQGSRFVLVDNHPTVAIDMSATIEGLTEWTALGDEPPREMSITGDVVVLRRLFLYECDIRFTGKRLTLHRCHIFNLRIIASKDSSVVVSDSELWNMGLGGMDRFLVEGGRQITITGNSIDNHATDVCFNVDGDDRVLFSRNSVTHSVLGEIQPLFGVRIAAGQVRVTNNEFNLRASTRGLYVSAGRASISHNTLMGPSEGGELGFAAIALQNCSIGDNTIWGYPEGIRAVGLRGRVTNNKVTYSHEEIPWQHAPGEIAIDDYGPGHLIEGNQMANYKTGIHARTEDSPRIRNNTFDGVDQEVLIDDATYDLVT